MDTIEIIAIIGMMCAGVVVFWNAVVGLIAFVGGWHALAKQYPDSAMKGPETASFSFQSVRFGFFSSYNGVIRVTAYAEGFSIRPIFLYAFMHRPIFFPWSSITGTGQGKFILPYVTISIGKKNLMIFGKSAAHINEQLALHQ
ncbi:MAG TPA: hypothetical protein PK253_17830 [Spirochaetota bacterium]|nr:hypothetical protein [Spirochaetota bacterium]